MRKAGWIQRINKNSSAIEKWERPTTTPIMNGLSSNMKL